MVSKSFIVKDVALQFIFALCNDFFLLHDHLIGIFHLFVNVACVVAASAGTVLLPITQAEPAELMSTFGAGHVIAALVFLNKILAARARLGVGLDPSKVFRVILFFFFPHFDLDARSRDVILLAALEAEKHSALALNETLGGVIRSFDNQTAVLAWTPLDISIFLGEFFAMPLQILFKVVLLVLVDKFRQEIQIDGVRNHNVAPQLRTLCKNAHSSLVAYFVL
jgi:hypothetical protein